MSLAFTCTTLLTSETSLWAPLILAKAPVQLQLSPALSQFLSVEEAIGLLCFAD